MLVAEYDAMMAAKGTPKVWVVAYGSSQYGSGMVHKQLFLTEGEARAEYDSIPATWYRKVYRTWDIWGFTERERAKRA